MKIPYPFMTDSYKFGSHFNMYPEGTEFVHSYFECRDGAQYKNIVFFGLQYYLLEYIGQSGNHMFDMEMISDFAQNHFGDPNCANIDGWEDLLLNVKHFPIRICAVPEGTVCKPGTVLMTIENTDPKFAWVTNYLETLFSKIWYPISVATTSYNIKKMIRDYMRMSCDDLSGLDFKLHDFGYRGASSEESAVIGGMAHLVNFKGSDTIAGVLGAAHYYTRSTDIYQIKDIAYSVPASEHSVMTALGESGEPEMIQRLLNKYPNKILSVVGDSYNIERFVTEYVCKTFKDQIQNRDGTFVVRPDSLRHKKDTPEKQVIWIVNELDKAFGSTVNSKGYRVLNPKVRVLWGDGIDAVGIDQILYGLTQEGYSVDNVVFGMGGALLQRVNRDTLRCAFKASAQCRNGIWTDVQKKPLDESKKSKAGKFAVIMTENGPTTININDLKENQTNLLEVVLENGKLMRVEDIWTIRKRVNESLGL